MAIQKKHASTICSMLTLVAVALSAHAASAQGTNLFTNFNSDGVVNGPRNPTMFTLQTRSRITEVETYHWNNRQGSTPGTISLQSQAQGGGTFGPYRARGQAGQGGAKNVNWVATLNLVLPAGTYTVLDSDPGTWSNNGQSNFRGFAVVRGSKVGGGGGPPPPPPPPPVPYGGNCRGRGCTHPDLISYGGSGNCSMTGGCLTAKSVHLPFNPQAFYWGKVDLQPSATVATLAQQCTRQHGQLVLLDDEPYYYYFIGRYARFGCRK